MKPWQKELPICKASVLHPEEQKELFRSSRFSVRNSSGAYEAVVAARYGDYCRNGINALHVSFLVCMAGTTRESEHYSLDDAPKWVLDALEPYRWLEVWQGCTTAGPWYYIENTLHYITTRDSSGLEKGQYRQIHNGKTGLPSWHMVVIDPDGVEMPAYAINHLYPDSEEKPAGLWRIEWRPWYRIGEGKSPELDAARRLTIWLDATDDDLLAPGLEQRLKDRLPALLEEFRGVVEKYGFVW